MSTRFEEILNREVTRKEFIKLIFAGALALFGLPALLGILSGHDKHDDSLPGYGMHKYGP